MNATNQEGTSRVRVSLQGGLGNQLFQAAAAIALCRRLDAKLEFDLSRFSSTSKRGYALAPFKHGARTVCLPQTLANRVKRRFAKLSRRLGIEFVPGWQGRVYEEPTYAFDTRFEDIIESCYLIGYFQSWRYFSCLSSEVRDIFNPMLAASPEARTYAANIGPNSLSIHIRSGDYATDPRAREIHGVLPEAYYQRALQLAREQRQIDQVFCFSDSPVAARLILAAERGIKFVEGHSASDDMYLMSLCPNHIIANSTFSYWSAWLGRHPDPFVIAPTAWFSQSQLHRVSYFDLYPSNWKRV